MKAWKVYNDLTGYSTIVFAETSGKAKQEALSTDCCEDMSFTEVRLKRCPEADELYRGRFEIDWYDTSVRLMLVKDFGWACEEPSFECDGCVAKKYCEWWEEENDQL